MTAAESKATYGEIQAYVKEHTGLKIGYLCVAQVKRENGIIERVNYSLPKSEKSRTFQCPPAKEEAITEAPI